RNPTTASSRKQRTSCTTCTSCSRRAASTSHRSRTSCGRAQLVDRDALDARLGLRQPGVEPLEGGDEDLRDAEVARPVVVGGNDVPRRPGRRGLAQRVLVRGLELAPQRTVLEVAVAELPALLGVLDPLLEAFPLLLFRDVQEDLHHGCALVREHALEAVDLLVPALPYVLLGEAANADCDDVLVVRAVEDHDLSP